MPMKRAVLGLLVLSAIGAGPVSSATAATASLGQVAPAGSVGACTDCTSLQDQTDPASPSYAVPPGNWTVTSWSMMSGTTTTGLDQIRIFRPEAGGNYRLIAESNYETVTMAPTGALRTFATGIPVQGGDHIGLKTGNPSSDAAYIYASPNAGDLAWLVNGFPVTGDTIGPTGDHNSYGINPSARVNMAATLLQPDPLNAPPETTITSGPGKRTASGKAKFKFESSEAGSTFVCKRDKKPFRPCSSPLGYRVDPGKHKLMVQAIDSAGAADPTPAKKKFSVPSS
jgi:hypothetical protein